MTASKQIGIKESKEIKQSYTIYTSFRKKNKRP